jgi:hypothetical protein
MAGSLKMMVKKIEARQVDTLLNDIRKAHPIRLREYRKAKRRASILNAINWFLGKIGL